MTTPRPEAGELAARVDKIMAEYWAAAESENEDAALRSLAKAFAQTEAALRATSPRPDVEGLREALDELSKQAAVLRTGDVNAAHQAIGIDFAIHNIRAALAAAKPSPTGRRSCDPREHGGKHAPWCPALAPAAAPTEASQS